MEAKNLMLIVDCILKEEDVNKTSIGGHSMLLYVCSFDSIPISLVERLLDRARGACTEFIGPNGYYATLGACRAKNIDVLKLLLQHGASPDGIDGSRHFPLW